MKRQSLRERQQTAYPPGRRNPLWPGHERRRTLCDPQRTPAGREHRRGGPGDGQFRTFRSSPGPPPRRLAAGSGLGQRLWRRLAAERRPGVRAARRRDRRPAPGSGDDRAAARDPAAGGHSAPGARPIWRSAAAHGWRCGLLFGGERAGLETADVALCQAIVTVPVDDRFRSLNLAQAVAINAYEWRLTRGRRAAAGVSRRAAAGRTGGGAGILRAAGSRTGGRGLLSSTGKARLDGAQSACRLRSRPADRSGGADLARRGHRPGEGPRPGPGQARRSPRGRPAEGRIAADGRSGPDGVERGAEGGHLVQRTHRHPRHRGPDRPGAADLDALGSEGRLHGLRRAGFPVDHEHVGL